MKKLMLVTVLVATLLVGCSKAHLDKNFDLTDLGTLTDSSKRLYEQMSDQEKSSVQWAVDTLGLSNITSIEKLKEQYGKDINYRKVLKFAIDRRKQEVADEYERLKSIETEWTDLYQDLSKIKASNIQMGTSQEFFTRGDPLVSFDVHNGSQQNVSSVRWEISLYLDDQDTPYTTYVGGDHYTIGAKKNGLKAGETVRRSIAIDDFGFNDAAKKWTDLTAQNAKKKGISVNVIPTSAKDFSEEHFITGNVPEALKQFESEKAIIEQTEQLLN